MAYCPVLYIEEESCVEVNIKLQSGNHFRLHM